MRSRIIATVSGSSWGSRLYMFIQSPFQVGGHLQAELLLIGTGAIAARFGRHDGCVMDCDGSVTDV